MLRLYFQFNVKTKIIFFLQSGNQHLLEGILDSFMVQNNLLYNQITRLSYGGTNTRTEDSSNDYCLQSEIHRKEIKKKYPPNKLYIVTRSISGISAHDLSVTKGTIVGVIKTQNPMGDTSKWFVDNGAMQGFLENQYLELSEEAKLIEESASTACIESSTDLMSLDSPVKDTKRYSADLQAVYSNINVESDCPPRYESIVSSEQEPRQLYENIRDEVSFTKFL